MVMWPLLHKVCMASNKYSCMGWNLGKDLLIDQVKL